MRSRIVQKIKVALATAGIGVALVAGGGTVALALPGVAYAQATTTDTTSVCKGVSLTGGGCNGDATQFTKVIKFVVNLLSYIAGVAATIMIIVGGIKYTTSGGDSSKVSSAKQSIIYAVIGLVVVALSQFIVRFVLTNATK